MRLFHRLRKNNEVTDKQFAKTRTWTWKWAWNWLPGTTSLFTLKNHSCKILPFCQHSQAKRFDLMVGGGGGYVQFSRSILSDSATPWIAARQASLSITNSRSLLILMSSSHLILCRPLLLLPPIPPSIRVFSNESALRMRWPKYWSFNFSISPSSEHPGLISFRMDWLDLLAVQGTLKCLNKESEKKGKCSPVQGSVIAQSCQTLCDPMDCSPPGSSVHGDFLGKNTGVGCHSLLQRIFLTQRLSPGLRHSRQILYHLRHQGGQRRVQLTCWGCQSEVYQAVNGVLGRKYRSFEKTQQILFSN